MDKDISRFHFWGELERNEVARRRWRGTPYEIHLETRTRIERVINAFDDSKPMAIRMLADRLAGISFHTVQDILIEACRDVAICYGGAAIGGGMIGGFVGAFGGGIGAAPGAAVGAGAAIQVATWAMSIVGLKSLVEYFGDALPHALECYRSGFKEAWGSSDSDSALNAWGSTQGNAFFGAARMAEGHVILVMAILSALVTYWTRGRGDKAVLLQEIRSSRRLGPKVAEWLEKNEAQLKRHPGLQGRPMQSAAQLQPSSSKKPSSGKPQESAAERTPAAPHVTPLAKVRCFEPHNLPQQKIPEFDRQLVDQERGINAMTVSEYLDARAAFKQGAVARDQKVARQARKEYQDSLVRERTEKLVGQGLDPASANEQAARAAKETMDALAALHSPDMVAGGADEIAGFGDRNVNSRIGRQWKDRIAQLDAAANDVPDGVRKTATMNAKLARCK